MVRRLADVMDTEGMSEVTVMLSEAAMLVANTAKRNGDDLKHATWNALANDLREGVEEERDARG